MVAYLNLKMSSITLFFSCNIEKPYHVYSFYTQLRLTYDSVNKPDDDFLNYRNT